MSRSSCSHITIVGTDVLQNLRPHLSRMKKRKDVPQQMAMFACSAFPLQILRVHRVSLWLAEGRRVCVEYFKLCISASVFARTMCLSRNTVKRIYTAMEFSMKDMDDQR